MGIVEDLAEAGDFLNRANLGIVSHNDSDGIASAAMVSLACKDGFQTRIFERFDLNGVRALAEGREALIILDMGSDRVEELSKIGKPILVLDHHPPSQKVDKEVNIINPHFYGLDGAFECCASTLAYYLTEGKNQNKKNLVIALAGIIGDMQHLEVKGLNTHIFERADEELKWEKRSILNGEDLRDALINSVEPFINGVSGNREGVEKFLKGVGLDGDEKMEELSEKEMEKLNSALVIVMLKENARPEMVKRIVAKRYRCGVGGIEFVDELSRILNGCGKLGRGGLAAAALLDENRVEEASRIAKRRDSDILKELNCLELKNLGGIRYFWSNYGSELATIIVNYLSSDRPVFGLSKKNDVVKISARGSKELVRKGLNLSKIMAATKGLKGGGGGHSVAAGGRVPVGEEEGFLRLADELVREQIG